MGTVGARRQALFVPGRNSPQTQGLAQLGNGRPNLWVMDVWDNYARLRTRFTE